MIISQLPELFVQRERALLGPRFDAMFSYPLQLECPVTFPCLSVVWEPEAEAILPLV